MVQLPSIYFCPRASVQWHIKRTCVTVVPKNFSKKICLRYEYATKFIECYFHAYHNVQSFYFAKFCKQSPLQDMWNKMTSFWYILHTLVLTLTANLRFQKKVRKFTSSWFIIWSNFIDSKSSCTRLRIFSLMSKRSKLLQVKHVGIL